MDPPKRDLYALLQDNAGQHYKLQQLWDEANTVPSWVDYAQLERGQNVFYRYGGPALTGLAYQSLLGGMGASRVVETLARTGGFSTKVAYRRLLETTQHILQCTKSLESVLPGGDGFKSSIRVRFLHAAVRKRILGLARERPEYFNVGEWGVPINDLDSIGTIATFSAVLIWMSLPRQGIFMRKEEITDYIALWRYIAHIVGCPTDSFETPAKARAIHESLFLHEVNPSETSKILANNIIKSLASRPPAYASADMLIASARWLNGNDLADRLGLPRPSLYFWALMFGQCFFFVVVSYGYRSIPSLDRKKIGYLKKLFYAVVVESKYGLAGTETLFEFKYVPEYKDMTGTEDSKSELPVMQGVDKRNLKYLLIGLGFGAAVIYGSIKLLVWLGKLVMTAMG